MSAGANSMFSRLDQNSSRGSSWLLKTLEEKEVQKVG